MLASLSIRGFRNLDPLELTPDPGTTLLLGANGAGKTSILEAIYLLATTKSFRTSQVLDCVRHQDEGFWLAGEVEGDQRSRLEVSLVASERHRTVNGHDTSLADHLAVLPVVAWTSAEADVVSGPPAGRRLLLDRGIVGLKPAAIDVLARYRRALGEKRALLAGARGSLQPWNELLAEMATELVGLRAAYFERLRRAFLEVLEASGLDLPVPELSYRPNPRQALEGSPAVLAELERMEGEERRRGQTLLGPHRDDVEILFRGAELRRVASAGERKALSLLLSTAQGCVLEESGRSPIYLLDDLDAELALATLGAIWRPLASGRQVFATSNRAEVRQVLEPDRCLRLEAGKASLAEPG